MTTRQSIPSAAAPQASACAWLPAEIPITPRAFSSALSEASLLRTPRALNEPVLWKSSAFSQTARRAVRQRARGEGRRAVDAAADPFRRSEHVWRVSPASRHRRRRTVDDHPVRITVDDDLQRSRLTVFFRLLLAIPHLIWLALWSVAVVLRGVRRLVRGALRRRGSRGLARLPRRVRPLRDARRRLPLARGEPVSRLHRRARLSRRRRDRRAASRSRRWRRRSGSCSRSRRCCSPRCSAAARRRRRRSGERHRRRIPIGGVGGVAPSARSSAGSRAVARGRMPRGLRDLAAYGLGYGAQTYGYLLLAHRPLPDSRPGRRSARPGRCRRIRSRSSSSTTTAGARG